LAKRPPKLKTNLARDEHLVASRIYLPKPIQTRSGHIYLLRSLAKGFAPELILNPTFSMPGLRTRLALQRRETVERKEQLIELLLNVFITLLFVLMLSGVTS
jgi:hypothetical protein